MFAIQEPFQMVEGYKLEQIYSDEISEIHSFFNEKHYTKKGIKKRILDEKRDELNQISTDAWNKQNPLRVEAFLDWLYNHSQEWEKLTRPHLLGLEWDFFLKLKKTPCDNYLIMREDTYKELHHKEQVGIIFSLFCPRKNIQEACKNCEEKLCLKWINKNGKRFRDIFEESYIEPISKQPYKVYKNPERKLYKLIKEDLENQSKNNNQNYF